MPHSHKFKLKIITSEDVRRHYNGYKEKKSYEEFIESSTAAELSQQVLELEEYIKGGDKTLKEAYGHIPKPKARKIKTYLYGILEDAWRYNLDKRRGRKKRSK